jgi:hypothetical protein
VKNWSEADDEKILHLLSQGRTRKQIAVYFGVTRNAICGRVHRLEPTLAKPSVEVEDPRITNRKKIIRSLTSAMENSTDEVFRERALWIIETKQSEINCLLAVADCHADS